MEASRRAARLAMELLVVEEPVASERMGMDNLDEEEQEIVRTGKNILPFFSRNTLYSRLRRGLILRKSY